MPTHFDQCDHDTHPRQSTDEPRQNQRQRSTITRLAGRVLQIYRNAGRWLGRRVAETRDWARQQRPRMLVQAAVLGAIGLLLAYAGLRLVATLVTGLWSWIVGGSDTAEPAPAPQPDGGSDVPGWIAALEQQPLWTGLWDNVVGWFTHQAAVAGVPMLALLIAWAVAGALLLLAAGYGGATLAQDIPWWGWLAATCVLVWTHTPGHSPLPAVLVGTVGVVASTVPLAGLLLACASTGLGVLIAMH